MDSPGKATAHMTTSYLNRRVWIQSVSRRRKIGRKAGISSQRAQGMMFPTKLNCKVRSSCIIVLFAQTAPPPLTLVMLHHDVHCWVAASYKHILAEHWAKIRFQCLHKVLRATKTIINRTWKIRRRDGRSRLISQSAGNKSTNWLCSWHKLTKHLVAELCFSFRSEKPKITDGDFSTLDQICTCGSQSRKRGGSTQMVEGVCVYTDTDACTYRYFYRYSNNLHGSSIGSSVSKSCDWQRWDINLFE